MQSRKQENDGQSKLGENRLYGTSAASSSIAGGLAHQTQEDHDIATAMQIAEMNVEESPVKGPNQQLVQESASSSAQAPLQTFGAENNVSFGNASSRTVFLERDVQRKKRNERSSSIERSSQNPSLRKSAERPKSPVESLPKENGVKEEISAQMAPMMAMIVTLQEEVGRLAGCVRTPSLRQATQTVI